MSDDLAALATKYAVLEVKLEMAEKELGKVRELAGSVDRRQGMWRKFWWALNTVFITAGSTLAFIGNDYYQDTREFMQEEVKRQAEAFQAKVDSAKTSIDHHVETSAKMELREFSLNTLGYNRDKLNRLYELDDRIQVDPLLGEVVVTCNRFRIQPTDTDARTAGTSITIGFTPSESPRPNEVSTVHTYIDVRTGTKQTFSADFDFTPDLVIRSGNFIQNRELQTFRTHLTASGVNSYAETFECDEVGRAMEQKTKSAVKTGVSSTGGSSAWEFEGLPRNGMLVGTRSILVSFHNGIPTLSRVGVSGQHEQPPWEPRR